MSAYLMISYDVSDEERFKDYNPGSLQAIFATISGHGGEIVGAGPTDVTVGAAASTCVCIKFPSADAAKAWQGDDEYAPLKAIRYESTTNITECIVPGMG